jgi:antitoxin Phd
MGKWQLQEAKNRLSELVRKAQEEGPQVITRRGEEVVVVVASNDYQKFSRRPKMNLLDFFRRSPLVGVDLDLRRSRDTGRSVRL